MKIFKKNIKKEFKVADSNLEFCWSVLEKLKTSKSFNSDFANNFIKFQETLAETILRLQYLRGDIIFDEKYYIKNKKKYNFDWFKAKMKRLSDYKKGVDSVIYISKSLGDAYAYFFYQFDRNLYTKHLDHERVVNHLFSSGKLGELEFIKKVKHIDGYFTLFHDITHVLRYGDFSFIDLREFKIKRIGELKTKTIDKTTLESTLLMFDREQVQLKNELTADERPINSREDRQKLGIINFLKNKTELNLDYKMNNPSYSKEIEKLISEARINQNNINKVSPGLAFSCYRQKKASLYTRIFNRKIDDDFTNEQVKIDIQGTVKSLMKPELQNSLFIGELLYDHKLRDKSLRGTIPLFWHSIKIDYLYKIYFTDCLIFSFFNPGHIINEVQELGYKVYSKQFPKQVNENKIEKSVEKFDLFYPYITNYLMTENFIKQAILKIEGDYDGHDIQKVFIKPQQQFE